MPVYERVCQDCGETNDFVESIELADLKVLETRCPSCGKIAKHKKVLSTFRFAFGRGGQAKRIR